MLHYDVAPDIGTVHHYVTFRSRDIKSCVVAKTVTQCDKIAVKIASQLPLKCQIAHTKIIKRYIRTQ